MDLAPRLNLITGDNGLGKSFLLDVAWWALTRTWARLPARPTKGATNPTIEFSLDSATESIEVSSAYDRKAEDWTKKRGRPHSPGLVIYAQVDGGFSVWDPARNYWRVAEDGSESYDRPPAYLFSPQELWDGLRKDGRPICRGLIEDWASWQELDQMRELGKVIQEQTGWKTKDDAPIERAFALLRKALAQLSPSEDEALVPGPLTRISLDDVRDIPTLHLHGRRRPDRPRLGGDSPNHRALLLAGVGLHRAPAGQRAT